MTQKIPIKLIYSIDINKTNVGNKTTESEKAPDSPLLREMKIGLQQKVNHQHQPRANAGQRPRE